MRVVIILTQESDQRLYKPALESLRSQIRASTTSMTSVPKPLKFLRPHYDSLKEVHEKIKDDETKVAFRNYLSSELFILILHCLNSSVDTDKGYYFVFVFFLEQRFCADIISVLGMTMSDGRDSLKFRLLGSKEEIGSWGHEYVR